MPSRMVFGDDHSAGSDVAWGWISTHQWPGWSTDIVSVHHADGDVIAEGEMREWQPRRPRFCPGSSGLKSVRHLRSTGSPRRVLEAQDASLIVIGSRGPGLLKAMRVGSTAESLIRSPRAPVVVARTSRTTRTVLVCVDGSEDAFEAVRVLATLPWISQTTTTVLGVGTWDEDLDTPVIQAAATLSSAGAQVRRIVTEPAPIKVAVSPELVIFEHLDAMSADLVVLGTRGRTGLARVWTGSVASSVAHHAACSVLIARAQMCTDVTAA